MQKNLQQIRKSKGMERGSPVAASNSSSGFGAHVSLPRGAAKRKGSNPVPGGGAAAGQNPALFNPVLMGGLSALLPTAVSAAAAASNVVASGTAGIDAFKFCEPDVFMRGRAGPTSQTTTALGSHANLQKTAAALRNRDGGHTLLYVGVRPASINMLAPIMQFLLLRRICNYFV